MPKIITSGAEGSVLKLTLPTISLIRFQDTQWTTLNVISCLHNLMIGHYKSGSQSYPFTHINTNVQALN